MSFAQAASQRKHIVKLALALAFLVITSGMAIRQAESQAMRLVLKTSGVKKDFPSRRLVEKAIKAIYDHAISQMTARLQAAPSFGIVFDGWTARSLFDAYIAVLYTFVDDDFKVLRCHHSLLCFLTSYIAAS